MIAVAVEECKDSQTVIIVGQATWGYNVILPFQHLFRFSNNSFFMIPNS